MTDITLSDTQTDAVKRTVAWFRQCRSEIKDGKPLTQQVFRLFGYAGVGKSTILKYVMEEIGAGFMPRIERGKRDDEKHDYFDDRHPGLPDDRQLRQLPPPSIASASAMVLCAAFTGKASLVMTRKGTPASTIHSLIYKVTDPTKAAIEEAKEKLAHLRENPPTDPAMMLLWKAQIRDREIQIKNMHRPTFIINTESPVVDCDMICLDEVSMVGDDMAADLLSFNKPMLVLGDPGQLPPIKGEGAFTSAKPDILLTEIHRQAGDSAIIRLATMAREGQPIPFGRHSELVYKMRRKDVPLEWLSQSDQVLCGYNATRFMLNNEMRRAAGYDGLLPREGAKIICLKNVNSEGLINGMFLKLSDVSEPYDHSFAAKVETEDGQKVGVKSIYRGHFDDHVAFDKDRAYRDYWNRRGLMECTWGYGITVHKSQGSQWDNVCLYDDGFGRGPDRHRWLYTGITRAESGLLIVAN